MKVADLVLPHDLTPLSDRALAALEARQVTADRVHVVHVLPRFDRSHPAFVWSRDEDEPRRAAALRHLRERLVGTPWAQAAVHVVIGDPAIRIVELAQRVGADLVALGSHSRRGLGRLLLGSVAEHVARFAPCAVMILPATAVPAGPRTALAPPSTEADRTVDDQVDALAVRICELVQAQPGFLSALRIGLPPDADPAAWEDALVRRLGAAGIEFVDLAFTATDAPSADVLAARFEALPGEP